MKKMLFAVFAFAMIAACNNEKKKDDKKETKTSDNITYPYKADYSSDFSMGDAQHAKMVLDLYKMWEDNKLDDMKPLLADSVSIEFPDGNKFNDNTADSMLNFARQYRATLKTVMTKIDGWMPVHANDKNEDYVLVWSRDYNTDMSGKVDSTRGHTYFQIKNNKIRSWSEYQQKLTPPAAMNK